MKKIWIGISLLILCLCLTFSVSWAQKAVGPKLVIEEKAHDFKQVAEGEKLQHTFTVRNTGDKTLEVKNVKPG